MNKTQAKVMFKQYDTNKSGKLTEEQFHRFVYDYYKIPKTERNDNFIHDMLAVADGVGFLNRKDGLMNFDEFFLITSKLPMYMTEPNESFCRVIFDIIDRDHSSYLDLNELKHLTKRIGVTISSEMNKALFSEYDVNHDGKISFEEFSSVFLKKI